MTGAGAAARMRAIAAALTSAGLAASLHDTRGVLDITAALHQPGKQTEVVIDDDGYVEIRYWNHPDAAPGQITDLILRALAAITPAQRT